MYGHERANFVLSSNFFFNDTATTEIYTLSLHDALPISRGAAHDLDPLDVVGRQVREVVAASGSVLRYAVDRSEEHTSELQSQSNLVCRLLLEKKKLTILLTQRDTVVKYNRQNAGCHVGR